MFQSFVAGLDPVNHGIGAVFTASSGSLLNEAYALDGVWATNLDWTGISSGDFITVELAQETKIGAVVFVNDASVVDSQQIRLYTGTDGTDPLSDYNIECNGGQIAYNDGAINCGAHENSKFIHIKYVF